ncbi:beta/alpha barrel domain-containing protein [Fulvivirga lutea]|uniref:Phosphoribosylanthranilate isomerase n=1 Tax=Fulvivirga lutea TaxID=2810512 RepID=A0A974WG27_9BACT|nr:phosphoribosylanthranilate isomerase [Fulvivirga lutea]QSE96392.1 phosphoribosylanthranilate isomerase [Fulvivirga lutea]
MALKTFVKINSVNNLSDARYCAGMNVNIIGFKAGIDENSVSPEQFKEITSWVSGVDYCLEFESEIDDAFKNYDAQYIQSGNQSELLKHIGEAKLIYSTELTSIDKEISSDIDYIIINGANLKDETQLNQVKELAQQFKVLLGSGFDDSDINDILDATPIAGIAITAGDEIRPGFKDYDELADVLEAIEIDEWA